jgi:thiaminase (transcriptional activator TenA)
MTTTTTSRFTDELRTAATDLWQAQLDHPFLEGIVDGSLDPDRFRYYIRQDYLYLIDYGRAFAIACAKAPRLETMRGFAELAQATLGTEMDLHRSYAAEWGVSQADFEAEQPGLATRAYADFLLRTAAVGDFGELVAALLPCMWGYSWLGRKLAERPAPDEERYARWIEMYASDDFAELAEWCRGVCDEASADAGADGRTRMRQAFLASSGYEVDFWDAGWNYSSPAG